MNDDNKPAVNSHTPEPWRLGKFKRGAYFEELPGKFDVCADTDNGVYVLASTNTNFPEDAEANARRIVACVNACEGISTEYLETTGLPEFAGKTLCTEMLQAELDKVEQQRDQLQQRVAELESQQLSWRMDYLDERDKHDQLLAALDACLRRLEDVSHPEDQNDPHGAIQLGFAAIAAVKGSVIHGDPAIQQALENPPPPNEELLAARQRYLARKGGQLPASELPAEQTIFANSFQCGNGESSIAWAKRLVEQPLRQYATCPPCNGNCNQGRSCPGKGGAA